MAPGLHEFLSRFTSLFRKDRLHDEMAEELDFHQSLLREKLLRQSVPQSQVDSTLRKTFGNPSRWHERLRELWQFRTVENLLRDVSFSLRLLKKSPGFTAVAVLTLALGVGANTAVFSIINGLLLRPLPVPHADQLAVLGMGGDGPNLEYDFCTPFFRALESRHDLFANVFAFEGDTMQVRGTSGNENIPGAMVSGEFFQSLEVQPILGRVLTPQDDQTGGNPNGFAVVISEGFWKDWFNRAPDVVGRKLIIANTPFTVAGVMPKQFIGADPAQRPQIFAPLSAEPIIEAPRHNLDEKLQAWWLTVLARRKPEMSLKQTSAALLTISDPILRETADDPGYLKDQEKNHFRFTAESGSRGFTYARFIFRKPLIAMFSMCIGILVLACLNLASLLMARAAARERELATRLALGATRKRLVQQLLVESALIAVLGTFAGFATVPLVNHSLAAMHISDNNGNENVQVDTSADAAVFGYAGLVAIVATMLIGLVPALQATRRDLNDHIKEGQHTSHLQERRSVLPRILLASEVALALVVVVGAGLLATSLTRLYQSGAGFNPRGLVNVAFSMDKQQREGDPLMQLYHQIGDELSHQPGVKGTSFEFIVPLSHRGWNGRFVSPGNRPLMIWMNSVGPKYFETMDIPLYQGREFTWSDSTATGLKIILNEKAAKLYFPDRPALGQQITDPRAKTSYVVVGVVADTKYKDMRTPAPPTGFVPIQQDDQPKPSLTAVVRTEGPAASLASAAHAIAARLAPSIPAPIVTPVSEVVDNSMVAERMMALLTVFFATCALLVTAIGLYGTLAYSTSRRTSEIGIRMALGAQRAGVVVLVFRENAVVAIAGCGAGLVAAFLASRTLASFLFETSPRDPWILLGSVAALTAIASAASLIPAIRAARTEPITAIRCE